MPWQARASVKIGTAWYVGTDSGKIAQLTGRCADFGDPMVRRYVSRTLDAGERFTVAKIEAFPRIEGIFKATATRPRPRSRWKCREMVASPMAPRDRGVGAVGAYETRLVWRALGQFRKATMRLSISSTTDIPLLSEIGRSSDAGNFGQTSSTSRQRVS